MFKRPKFLNDWLYAYWGWRTRPKGLVFNTTGGVWVTNVYRYSGQFYYHEVWKQDNAGKWNIDYSYHYK